MNKTHLLSLFLLLIFKLSYSQEYVYRSAENPYYWKNRAPYAGYWQQDVHYEIKAAIDDSSDIIDGHFFKLTYWNNSPHTLNELYFHLYQNAFQPESHMHDLYKNNDYDVKFGKYEAAKKGTELFNIQVNGTSADTVRDNTILKIKLNTPLLPNDSVIVTMQFKTYFDTGTLRRRMKTFDSFGEKHYDGVHWYPSITVYDRKFAWTTEQHLDKEFYADFGSFDVELTFPNHFIVDATGVLQNREEVLPDSLRKKLDISNFKQTVNTSSIIIPKKKGETKTWKFYAQNVHNFAFTADPHYRIGEIDWKGVKVVTLAREPNASKWQESGEFTRKVIKTYSEDFGMYAWPKIIVADANDGMEYPMLTLDNGSYPGHQSLLAHEVGHMWFYGMVGSNETYRAMLDEGFTQFLTIWSMDKITGSSKKRTAKSTFIQNRLSPYRNRYERLYYPYIKTVHDGFDKELNTHSSDFNGAIRHAGNYGLVYYKTGVMLYNLKYVLGDSLFSGAMKHYFNQWKMAHPYPEDFRNSITEYTQTDLNWFFDQWMETTKVIDYEISRVEKRDSNQYNITFSRLGEMQMPIDFVVIDKAGDSTYHHIPNTWFEKPTNATILPRWYGWGNIHKTYTATVTLKSPLKNVIIDPAHYLADVNLNNNQWKGGIVEFDHRVANLPDWENEHHYIRPDVWYNHFDGVQVGAHMEGNYFDDVFNYKLNLWGNTRFGQYNITENLENQNSPFSFDIAVSEKLNNIWSNLQFEQYGIYNVGLMKYGISLSKKFIKRDIWNSNFTTLTLNSDFMYRPDILQSPYLINGIWGFDEQNNSINISVKRNYTKQKLEGHTAIGLRTPGLYTEYNYSYLDVESRNKLSGKKLTLHTRVYGRLGFGDEVPLESMLFIAGASPEEMFENKYTRASAFFPTDWTSFNTNKTNHFQQGGGLNLRGYSGYLINFNNSLKFGGLSGISFSGEFDFQKILALKVKKPSKILSARTYIFADAGSISLNTPTKESLSPLLVDAGVGSTLTIKFPKLKISPLEIRFDLPLYLNTPPSGEQAFKYRYLVGINSSF